MEDWKERLKTEYVQVKERYDKLHAHNTLQEVKKSITLDKPICSEADAAEHEAENYRNTLLKGQERAMLDYLHILELRAALENIDLN